MKLLLKVLGTVQHDASQFAHLQKYFFRRNSSCCKKLLVPSLAFIHQGVMLISKYVFTSTEISNSLRGSHILLISKIKVIEQFLLMV